MELTTNPNPEMMVQEIEEIARTKTSPFIEANTIDVSLKHLRDDCIIPVFSKDNETTISHYSFINETNKIVQGLFPDFEVSNPNIRVSHIIKGRVPTAIGKPAKELLENEKTIYYERCAFVIEVPGISQNVNGNKLSLSVGGVRAYNRENLYSKKSLEKFQVFIGFKNMVCTNLCISTDGYSDSIRISSINELSEQIKSVLSSYDMDGHLITMHQLSNYRLTERQFAHFIGKCRMYHHLDKKEAAGLIEINLNDSQLNNVVKNYYECPNFNRNSDGSINLWNLYNLFTEANKSSYIDSNFSRNVSAYELVKKLGNSLENGYKDWFLD